MDANDLTPADRDVLAHALRTPAIQGVLEFLDPGHSGRCPSRTGPTCPEPLRAAALTAPCGVPPAGGGGHLRPLGLWSAVKTEAAVPCPPAVTAAPHARCQRRVVAPYGTGVTRGTPND